ncbi:universal stress protein [Sodalis sp. RH24]
MLLKVIVVFIDVSLNNQARLDYAVKIARRYGAHLAGLYIAPTYWETSPSKIYDIGSDASTELTRFQREEEQETLKKAREVFNAATHSEKIDSEFHIIKDSADDMQFRSILLYTDLIIVGTPGTNGLPKNWSAQAILLATDVPFLIVPNGWRCQ